MRFKVASVTGYTDVGRKHVTIWYVLDSAVCYRIVESFVGGFRRGDRVVRAEERARALAAELEEAYP